ncbi:PEP/pyruvate-binding domain-containing protein [Nocardiopsis coralli]|uniref:PEP/pyruvate-binding domain-containing protein n=1 Tax=Nocardiopsis coralli TaxID=2772213 RepID=UPI002E2BD0CC|nr:PEP/pyruvate-binding domain-containing protein [Nocardiopsis coralli]
MGHGRRRRARAGHRSGRWQHRSRPLPMGPDGNEGPDDGCLTPEQVGEPRAAGERLQRHFGSPQDAEWAYDPDGVLWLLQSRAITTLFPLPDDEHLPRPRAYTEVGNIQGLLRPLTPMGM